MVPLQTPRILNSQVYEAMRVNDRERIYVKDACVYAKAPNANIVLVWMRAQAAVEWASHP